MFTLNLEEISSNRLKSIVHSWQTVLSKGLFLNIFLDLGLRLRLIASLCLFLILFFSIDATVEPQSGKILGRLVNHGEGREINARMKVVMDGDTPVLCLLSIKPILRGSEILYHYGVDKLPWKNKKVWTHNYTVHYYLQMKYKTV